MMSKQIYKPVYIRKFQLMALGFVLLAKLLTLWPFLLLLWVLLAPTTPHMLVTYRYVGHYPHRDKTDCDYLGIKGWVTQSSYGGECSFIRLINPNKP